MPEHFIDQTDDRFMDKTRNVLEELPDYVSDFLNEKYVNGAKPSTIYGYAIDIKGFLNYFSVKMNTPVKDISVDQLAAIRRREHVEYLAKLRSSGYSIQARSRVQSAATGLYDYLINSGEYLIDSNILKSIPRTKLPRKSTVDYFSDDDLTTIKKSLDKGEGLTKKKSEYYKEHSQRDNLVITVLLTTGMRVSELVGINLEDFRRDYTEVEIIRKERTEQTIYLSEEARTAILEYIDGERKQLLEKAKKELPDLYQDCRSPLLLTVRGKYAGRISTVAIERLVKTHAANTDAKTKTPHSFRRTFGSNMLNDENFGDLGLTAELLGHSNPSTTLEFYSRTSQDRRKNASEAIRFRKDEERNSK